MFRNHTFGIKGYVMTPDGSPGCTSGFPRLITYTRRGVKGKKGNSTAHKGGYKRSD